MIAIHSYYETHDEWMNPSGRREAMDCISGAKAMGCRAILVWRNGRIIYQAIRRDCLQRMCIKFAMAGFDLL